MKQLCSTEQIDCNLNLRENKLSSPNNPVSITLLWEAGMDGRIENTAPGVDDEGWQQLFCLSDGAWPPAFPHGDSAWSLCSPSAAADEELDRCQMAIAVLVLVRWVCDFG